MSYIVDNIVSVVFLPMEIVQQIYNRTISWLLSNLFTVQIYVI